jgi:hypothetical protein
MPKRINCYVWQRRCVRPAWVIVSEGKIVSVLNYLSIHHEDVWWSGCIDPGFLDLGTSWRWVVSFTPRPLYPRGKSPRYPLNTRLSGPVWTTWRSENSWPYRDSNSDPSVGQPEASRYTDWAIAVLWGVFSRDDISSFGTSPVLINFVFYLKEIWGFNSSKC